MDEKNQLGEFVTMIITSAPRLFPVLRYAKDTFGGDRRGHRDGTQLVPSHLFVPVTLLDPRLSEKTQT